MTEPIGQEQKRVSLVAVLGSMTPPGRLRSALEQALERAGERLQVDTRLIDLADVRIGFADGRPPEHLDDDTAMVIEELAAADVVLLATPVYRGSLTGALKNLLDQLPVEALDGKPTAIVAMGHTFHHFLGAERHLRDVLSFFGAIVAPVASYLTATDFSEGLPGPRAEEELDQLISSTIDLAIALRERSWAPAPPPFIIRHRQRA